jgi:ribosomal protein S18 acetylase RimI-like enzyme
MRKLLREFEETVVDAWPATDCEELDGWLLRASGGPSRRGNSVAPLENGSAFALDERIAQVERWYAARGYPAMFQIGPGCMPGELDAILQLRGYSKEAESIAATAAPSELLQRLPGSDAQVTRQASEAWWSVVREASRFSTSRDVLAGFLARLGSRCRYVTHFAADGRASAACVGVSSEQRLGVYAMITLPLARRTGAASALLRALAHSALEAHMEEMYLLVEADNEPARALYERAGFRDLYRYHYRTQASL